MKILYYILITLLLSLGISPVTFGQNTLRGLVIDAQTKAPLSGVYIIQRGAQSGTITNRQGQFSLHPDKNGEPLIFSYVGYETKVIEPRAETIIIALSEAITSLDQVIVSASRSEQTRTDVPMAISKLSAKTLDETKPATLDQVLNKVSGVYMVNLGNEQHSMSIRQPLSYKSLFLYMEDGIPIRPTGVFNHNALIEINMAGVQDIEVMKGPASSIYGSEAIGGSVNFITQNPSAYPTAKLSLQGDNLAYKRVDMEAANTFGKLGLYSGGYYANRAGGYREHNDFHKLAFTLRGDYHINQQNEWTTTATLIDYKADMAGGIDSAMFYSKNYPSQHTFTYREVKALRLRSTLNHFWNGQSKTAFTAFYRNNLIGQNPAYRVKNDRQDFLKATGEINENTFQSYGAMMQHTQSLDFWEGRLIGGIALDYSPNQYTAEFISIDRNEEGNYVDFTRPDSLLTDYNANLLNTAAYTQLEVSPLQKLRLVLATRYDHFLYDYHNYLMPDAFSGAPDSKNTFHSLSPKVGFTFDLDHNRGFYANYSIGFVPPQVTELYSGVKVPVLEPSRYFNYELGGWFSFLKKGYLDVSLYQLEGNNELINVYLDDGTTENRNAGKTLHRGIEYTVQYSALENLRFRIGGTNALHKFINYQEGGVSFDGKRMNTAPVWIANAEATFYPAFLKGSRVGFEWQHVGPYDMDVANTEKYAGFNVFNIRLGYEQGALEVWTNILNVTNVLYATNASKSAYGKSYSPGDPITCNLGLAYHFFKNSGK